MTPIDRAALYVLAATRRGHALAIATWFAISALALFVGCAHTISDATRYADKSMAIVDVVANEGARAYQAATIAAVNACRVELGESTTAEQREACLRRKGFAPDQVEKVREAYESLARAYDSIADALDLIREAAPGLEDAERSVEGSR